MVDVDQQLRLAERQVADLEAWEVARRQLAEESGLDVADDSGLPGALDKLRDSLISRRERIPGLRTAGEQLSLDFARSGELARREELLREQAALRKDLAVAEEDLQSRRETGELAQRFVEAVRAASGSAVAERIGQIDPLLQRIYARVDPHPAFRGVRLRVSEPDRQGRPGAEVGDLLAKDFTPGPSATLWKDNPAGFFSSSQLNALAVSIFLSLNLGVASPPLLTAILDDPLQSLDDVNLLGLIDLLRRTKEQPTCSAVTASCNWWLFPLVHRSTPAN